MSSVTTYARYCVSSENRLRVIRALSATAELTEAEEGNMYFHAFEAEDGSIHLVEGWKSETALKRHRDTDHFQEVLLKEIVPYLEGRQVEVLRPLFRDWLV